MSALGIARTPQQIGALIRRARRKAKLSQKDLAARTTLRQETISKIENGHSATKLATICDVIAALDLEFTIQMRTKGTLSEIEDIF